MDLLTKTIVGVRREVRSTVLRSALQRRNYGCHGFLLGTRAEFTRPVFDLALVVKETVVGELYHNTPVLLESKLAAGIQVAISAETEVIGLFVAWGDFFLCNCRHEQFGIIIDTAARLELPYVAEFPVHGHESIWGLNIYFTNCFPHAALPYKMLPRRSHKAGHNPRRVLKLWRTLQEPKAKKLV